MHHLCAETIKQQGQDLKQEWKMKQEGKELEFPMEGAFAIGNCF